MTQTINPVVLNADAHRDLAVKLTVNQRQKSFIYWQIGVQLNLERGDRPLSADDLDQLSELYPTVAQRSTFAAMRRFAALAPSVPEVSDVLDRFTSWTKIKDDYLHERKPGETQEGERQRIFDQRSFTVPQATIEAVAANFGWTRDFTAKKMREVMDTDREYFASVFEARFRRAGFMPVIRSNS